ncbi:DUF4302 domain-containing protein [Pedobacter hiemivivus]|uniref:DUF4302 domain-containing protein n=1 Tax=Pedobacter hiemivivus TaxID=2530454 RepID=A0A4V2MJT9_9SPHI|nr:DUF4302 domain-containing protein [Pedobacter hiemivivus]TCC95516.1 DUF4302 domain-containing protein [Pedobacter hiemivivus]
MKIIYHITFLAVFVLTMSACKKEALLDGSKSIERSNALEKELKTQLQNSKDGWIMYLKTLDVNVKTSAPFVLKFDTVASKVTTKSIYGNEDRVSYFNISAATGAPLLTFSTGSILSDIYEFGTMDITDYFFKVLSVSKDVIEIQTYRKGTGSASEGGVVYKMIRNENVAWVKDWQQETAKLITQRQFFDVDLKLELTYASGEVFAPGTIAFFNQPAGNIAFFKASYPTVINNKQLDPIEFDYSVYFPVAFLGYNSIFWEVTTRFTPAEYFSSGPAAYQRLFKTNYFLIRKINGRSIDIFALDKEGKEVITGKISII